MYDTEEAAKHIADRTGQPLETVEKYQEAEYRYIQLLDLCELDDSVESVEQERQVHADLLTSDHPCDYSTVMRYVRRVTGLDAPTIADMMAEDMAYRVRQRIATSAQYPDCRAWADNILLESKTAHTQSERTH